MVTIRVMPAGLDTYSKPPVRSGDKDTTTTTATTNSSNTNNDNNNNSSSNNNSNNNNNNTCEVWRQSTDVAPVLPCKLSYAVLYRTNTGYTLLHHTILYYMYYTVLY